MIVAWVHPPTKISYVFLCHNCHMSSYVHACLKEDANTIPLASCWPFVFIIVYISIHIYIYIYIMFLSQSESLCLQVQEQKVDLNVIACSAVMSTRLSSSVWLQTSTCPWQALTCAAPFVSSCFLFADPFRTVSFSTVGFTHDGTGCPQRFTDSISWFLTILGTFFFRHVTTLFGSRLVPIRRAKRGACEKGQQWSLALGFLRLMQDKKMEASHDMSQPWRSQCG